MKIYDTGKCIRCGRGAILYPVKSKKLNKVVGVCLNCKILLLNLGGVRYGSTRKG